MIEKKKLFRNNVVDKKQLKQIMTWSFREFGIMKASYLATKLKDIGLGKWRYLSEVEIAQIMEMIKDSSND